MNIFIAGFALAGAGAGINELTALAVTSELAPTRKRGQYVAILVFTIIPFCPSVLWAQLIASHAGWRYCGALCGGWAAVGLLMTLIFYFPPPRVNSDGLSRLQVLKKIDYLGGFLSISGMISFLAGLQWGGYQYPWTSAHVLVPLFIGALLLVLFIVWEMIGAEHPMVPLHMIEAPRIFWLTMLITFISGANFFSVLLFWPTQAYNVYGHDPIGVGIRGLPVGFSILIGAFVVLWLLTLLDGRNRELLTVCSVLMTAGIASLASLRVDNLHIAYGLLCLAGLGIGGIVVPASIMTVIVCPNEFIATVAALTLAIRVIGGSIGYTVYYNVFISKFKANAIVYVGGAMTEVLHITSPKAIEAAIELTGAGLLNQLQAVPGIAGNETAYQVVVQAGQLAFAESYRWVYLASIAFGVVAVVASLALPDMKKYMDDHVAVVM
ncbi:uncharacterized protein KY384_006344 [Bacidia gigantensis]|uniref:uncharacterized protein n=1 Tax=Bacidia gigantensis TaxID=2732470 RepID=UPI001D03AE91|nr:uncharacterized protein KY384_006344 [Bacidia gigantensis]KAG8528657.1 hypothetical protein KY384_006344 [Bacidia gigantensis]